MKNEIIISKITQIISEQLKFESDKLIDWDQSLQKLGADSLDMVELIIKFEDIFKIQISNDIMIRLCKQAKLEEIIKIGLG